MRKRFVILFSIAMVVSLLACGKSEAGEGEETDDISAKSTVTELVILL